MYNDGIFFSTLKKSNDSWKRGNSLKAVVYAGMKDVKVENVDDPAIKNSDDAIIRATSTTINPVDRHTPSLVFRHTLVPNRTRKLASNNSCPHFMKAYAMDDSDFPIRILILMPRKHPTLNNNLW
jgi:hypothetical protein